MKKFLIPIGLFALLGVLLIIAIVKMQSGAYSPRYIPSPLIDKPLPAFSLSTLHDPKKVLTNNDLRGKVVLINVWASWCVSCRQEHPVLMALARQKQIPLIGLNHKDKRENALAFMQTEGNPYDVSLVDADGRVGIDWGVYGVPETFVIDRDGIIRFKYAGPISTEIWEKTIWPVVQQLSI